MNIPNEGWVQLDIDESTVVPITKNIFEIRDVTKKKSDYSKTIVFKGTERNNIYFAKVYNVSVDRNFDVKNGANVVIYRNDIEVLRGKMYLVRINDNFKSYEYECVVIGDVGDVFKKLDEIKLADVWDNLDTFNYTDAIAAQFNNPPSLPSASSAYPVFYALFDNGYPRYTASASDSRNIIPIVFTNKILEKCFNKVGYQLDSNSVIYNTTDLRFKMFHFLALVARHDWRKIRDLTHQQNNYFIAKHNVTVSTINGSFSAGNYYKINHKINASIETDPANHWDNTLYQISYIDDFLFSLKLNARLYVRFFTQLSTPPFALNQIVVVPITLKMYSPTMNDSHEVNMSIPMQCVGFISNTMYQEYEFEYYFGNTIFQHIFPHRLNKEMWIEITVSSTGQFYLMPPGGTYIQFDQYPPTEIYAYPYNYAFNSTGIKIKELMSDITAGEFVRNFMKMFNLFYKIENENVIKLDSFDTFYDSVNVLDINKYVDLKTKKQLLINDYISRYLSFKLKQNNSFAAKDHKEKTGSEYGEVLIDTEWMYKKDKKEETVIFSVPPAIYEGVILSQFCNVKDGKREPSEYPISLVLWNGKLVAPATPQPLLITEGVEYTNSNLNNIFNNSSSYPSIQPPIATHLWTNIAQSSWTQLFQYAQLPDFDLVFDTPKLVYFPTNAVTNRNIYYSFFYKFFRNILDKNNLFYSVQVAVPAHIDLRLDKIYYFDNNYWIISKINDWNVNHKDLATVEFIKVIDTDIIEFTTTPIVEIPPVSTPPTARVVNTDVVNVDNVDANNVSAKLLNIEKTISIAGIPTKENNTVNVANKTFVINYTDIPFTFQIIAEKSVFAIAYRVTATFNSPVTVSLNSNSQSVGNINRHGIIINSISVATQDDTISVTGAGLTSGQIIIDIIFI
jgi:hypothetical protein